MWLHPVFHILLSFNLAVNNIRREMAKIGQAANARSDRDELIMPIAIACFECELCIYSPMVFKGRCAMMLLIVARVFFVLRQCGEGREVLDVGKIDGRGLSMFALSKL